MAAPEPNSNPSSTTTSTSVAEPPWHASFPAPTLKPDYFPPRRALVLLTLKIASLLIIDVRRIDFTGGCIRGSLNIPAQGFYWNRGILYELAYKADIEWVVFTCGSSSEGGRAWRCAGWFLEHVRQTVGDEDMQIGVLEGGVKGWVRAGEEYRRCMDGFVESEWEGIVKGKEGRKKEGEKKDAVEASEQAGTIKSEAESAAKAADEAGEVKGKVWSYESMMND